MAQSIARGSIRADLFVRTTEVLAPDRHRDLARTLASAVPIVAGRRLRIKHDHPSNAPTVHARGSLSLLRLEAAAPHQDAVARITAG